MSLRSLVRGLSRYAVSGGVATASHYALMAGLVELGRWPAGLASVIGAALGALVAYGLNRAWTFAGHETSHRRALPRFFAVAGAGALLNGVGVWVGTAALGWHWLAAQVVSTLTVLVAGYFANRHWSFSRLR